jgi:NAD(P)-dependent dehydrogenase (short-subunit alcohol dehydrogenase family)
VVDFDDVCFNNRYSANEAYARSKLCIVMATSLIGARLGKERKGLVVSVHPGIVRTGILREAYEQGWRGKVLQLLSWLTYPAYWYLTKSPREGNSTTMFCLLSDSIVNGGYYA